MEQLRQILLDVSLLCLTAASVGFAVYPFLLSMDPAPWQFLLAAASLTLLAWLIERGWRLRVLEAKAEAAEEGREWTPTDMALVLLRPAVVTLVLVAARKITQGVWF